jgi:tRNA-uridine 2-sulfurtransferase
MKISNVKNKTTKRAIRALVLFSGGLDSILAVKVLEGQEIDATALTFVSHFFSSDEAGKSARENEIKIRIEDISDDHLKIVEKPCYGHGVGMNPCIDCHLLMLRAAKKIMQKDKYDFIATGEVLGQRPMSQNAGALKLIEKEADLEGKILRPLSAAVLPETEAEKKSFVKRENMFAISGRSRKDQMKLAKHFGIEYYPSPAGGCILTDREYSKKLRELFSRIKNPSESDITLLRLGRHFWIENTKIIIGRNHEENLKIKKLAKNSDTLIEPKNIPGPTALVRGKSDNNTLDFVKKLLVRYTKNAGEDLSLKITTG